MSTSNTGSGDDQLKIALDNFESILTPEQKKRLQGIAAVPDAPAIIAFTNQLDNENAKRGSRCVATRLLTFLQSIQQFTGVVDTFVSSNPATAALVWGSVKFAVLLASNYASYFDKLSALFMRLSKHCPRYSEYQILYADSVSLRDAICKFYATVINCCTHAVQIISISEPHGGFWRFFKTDKLDQFEKEIQECKSDVDAEISRALHQTISRQQQLQLIDQRAAARHRDLGSVFRIRVDKSNEEERRWRIQTSERQARTRKQELLNRLSNYDYMSPYRRASLKRHGQTAGWLIESTEFADWMADPGSNIFILFGKLGSGKTVTTARTIGHLFERSGDNYRIAYFFCQFDNVESLSASVILSALVRQLLDIKNLSESMETRLVDVLDIPSPEAPDLGALLKDVLLITKCSFIFIDAIDECSKSEWEVLLEVLRGVVNSCSGVIKIFLAVRQGMAEDVRKIFISPYQATMGSSKADSDIKTYIKDVLAEKKDSGKLVVGNPELINEITDALAQHANGMFLWVAFQIEDICSQVCDHDIRETIRKLPKNLPETYNRMLTKIEKMGKAKLAQKIFPWVAIARRPMLLEEIREAIGVEPLQPYSDPERLVNDMSQIISWCGNLIILDEQDGMVQFTHQTVKIFLLDSFGDQTNADFHFEHRKIENYVGEICVTYLNFNDFKTQLIKQPKGLSLPVPGEILNATLSVDPGSRSKSIWKKVARLREHRRGKNPSSHSLFTGATLHDVMGAGKELQTEYPFLSYAAKFWVHHTAYFERKKTQTWHQWERLLLSEDGPAYKPWKYSEWAQRTRTISRWICSHEHLALFSVIQSSETPFAQAEMQSIMNFSIERSSLNLLDSVLRECHNLTSVRNKGLIIAAGGGHLWATNRLLMEKADPNWRALEPVYTPRGGQNSQLPIAHANLNIRSKGYTGLTAIQVASKGGYLDVVDRLMAAKANVNAEAAPNSGRTALQAAAGAGHLEVVERLLTAKPDVNAKAAGIYGRTALQAAAEAGHLEVVERLLTAKADVNAEAAKYNGRTAVQAAAGAGHLEIVERLLITKADLNAKAAYYSGRTALQAATEAGYLEIVERLLTAKADVNAKAACIYGRTSLQAAAEAGHLEMVKRLLVAKADVNAKAAEFFGRTALQAAAGAGHFEVVESLLTAKADVNDKATSTSGRTALQAAAGAGHLRVVERLLTAKADVNAKTAPNISRIVLKATAEAGYLEVVERLITAKADVNAEVAKYNGRTAVQAAAEAGHLEIIERLLRAKADVNTEEALLSGQTALHTAAETGHLEVVERLLTAKADVNAEAALDLGRTAIQAAAGAGHLEIVERLLTAKADLNAKAAYYSGRTALQAAAEAGCFEVVVRLLTAKADVNAEVAKYNGRTALQAAAEAGHLEVVERLLTAKADVNANATSNSGRTALQAAAGAGHLQVVERLLTAKAEVNAKAAPNIGRTAVQAAAGAGHLEIVESLLTAKADVNAEAANNSGRTALQAAAGAGHLEIVERLLTTKADVNAKAAESHGRTALQAAAEAGYFEVVERLLTAKADVNAEAAPNIGRTALEAAAGAGHLEIVERLLTAKADVNAVANSYIGQTALQAAAGAGYLEIVERLLTAKADVNAEAANNFGRTALQAAAEAGHFEVFERLLLAKADVNAKAAESHGRTALQAAAGAGHLEVVESLLTAKADVNAEAALNSGRTALQAAAEAGHFEVVERLLTAKADVNAAAASNSGRTALQAAAEAGHFEVVERLLIAKADVNAEAAKFAGRTAVQAAAEAGHLEVVVRLLTAKADVNAKAAPNLGRTALQAAAEAGHLEVVERLLSAKVAKEGVRLALIDAKAKGADKKIIKLLEYVAHKG